MPSRTHLASTLLALTLTLGLASCGPATPEPSATPVAPSPVTRNSEPPVATPTPDMEALHAEAERVVWRWAELERSYLLDGEYEEYPPRLSDVLAEPYISNSRVIYEEMKALDLRIAPGTSADFTILPAPKAHKHGSEVALWVCQDTRTSPLVDAAGNVISPGRIILILFYFKHFDGALKLFYADSSEVVEACPSE